MSDLDHIALNVANIEKSVKWYQDNLNFEVEYLDSTWAMLRKGQTKLALTVASQHPPHVAFRVDELKDMPEGNIGEHRDGSKYLYKEDPDGNVFEWVFYP